MPTASSSIVIDAPAKLIYGIALDFEKYPQFLSDVKKASVHGKKGKDLLVDFELSLLKTIRYRLKVSAEPHKKIFWSLLEGDLFKSNDGNWIFEEQQGKTKATYTVTIEFGIFVPSLITSKLIGANLPSMMKKFKERAEGMV